MALGISEECSSISTFMPARLSSAITTSKKAATDLGSEELALPPLARHNFQNVPIEIEHDFESPILVIDGRRRKAAGAHIERHMPGMASSAISTLPR